MVRLHAAIITGLVALMALSACGRGPRNVSQFANGALATDFRSDGTPDDYSPGNLVGSPDVDGCLDSPTGAWAPAVVTSNDSLTSTITLGYPNFINVGEVDVFENLNPGSIVQIDLEASDGSAGPLTIWSQPEGTASCPSIFSVQLSGGTTDDQFDTVVITLQPSLVYDPSSPDDFPEINAVQMSGTD